MGSSSKGQALHKRLVKFPKSIIAGLFITYLVVGNVYSVKGAHRALETADTITSTATSTSTETFSLSASPTLSVTLEVSTTVVATDTFTDTEEASASATPTPSATLIPTESSTPTGTQTSDATWTPTPTPSYFPAPTAQLQDLAPIFVSADGNAIPGAYIVVYKPGIDAALAASDLLDLRSIGAEIIAVYDTVLQGYAANLSDDMLRQIRRNPLVDYITADVLVYLEDSQYDEINLESGAISDVMQNSAPWGLDRIDQRNLPLTNTYAYDTTARQVHVYVVDSGIRITHSEFEGRASNDFDAGGGNGLDCDGHGTHAAGIIGGKTYGVAKRVRLHSVRVFGCNRTTSASVVIAAIEWITDHHAAPAVVNMTLVAPGQTPIDAAVQNSIAAGITYVVTAGNDNRDACLYSPARLPAAITVGATMANDERAMLSNWGSCLDIFAPGERIPSAWWTGDSAVVVLKDTLMASPHVAGVAALYLSQNPTASPAQVAKAIIRNATVNVVWDAGAGSPNRLLFSVFNALHLVPTPQSPTGIIKDSTPTYRWTKVNDATHYHIQLRNSSGVIYNVTVNSSSCGVSSCATTPSTILVDSTYKWRVRAKVAGDWKAWSAFVQFVVK